MKKILFLTLIGILICSSAYALNLSRVKTWNASDVLTASDLNAEFDNIVNHAIVNADISASAAIVASKLDLTIGTPIGSTTPSTGAFSTLSATTAIPVTSGGMGAATFTDGGILIGNGTGAIVATAVLADGEILVGDGTTDPVAESGATLRTSIGCQASDAQLDDLADGSLSGAGTCNTSALTGTTYLPDATVDTTALKTATSEVSTTPAANLTFAGGQYCHYPQVKNSITNSNVETKIATDPASSSYVTNIYIYGNSGGTNYAITLYHTASGIDYWLWLLVDKTTKEVIQMAGAEDHTACGNGGDFEALPHPFRNYNLSTQEIILIEKEQAKAIQNEAKEKGTTVLELVDRDYRIDFAQTYPYVPIHSGKFSPEEKPVLVESIPDYIIVRRLILMDSNDKLAKENRQKDKQAVFEAEKILKENKKQAVLEKLKISREELESVLSNR